MRIQTILFCGLLIGCGAGTTTPLPASTLAVQIGPFDLASGVEIVKCAIVRVPITTDVDIVRIRTTLAPGSHHLIVYRSDATAEEAAKDCTSFDGVSNGETPIFIAESASSDLTLPAGVAYHFTAGQMVRLEAHYLNSSKGTIHAMGRVEMVPGTAGMSFQKADMMMCGSVASLLCQAGGGVDYGDPHYKLPVGFYSGIGRNQKNNAVNVDLTPLKFFAFTSHTHHRGTDVKVWKATSSSPTGDPIYENSSWSNPPLKTYDDAHLLTFGPNEGFAWQCTYDTSADTKKVCFGESAADNEMCFIWAYYYPSVGRFINYKDCWFN